jgi:hypothetical protein
MQLKKNIFLPILGMVFLILLNLLSFMNGALFLDKLLACSFILTIVFIGKIRESLVQSSLKGKIKKIKHPSYGESHAPLARRAL